MEWHLRIDWFVLICCRMQWVKYALKFLAQSDEFLRCSPRPEIACFRWYFLAEGFERFYLFLKNWLFYFHIKKFRFVALLGMKILCFCYRIQKFRIFHRLDERYGLIPDRQFIRFFCFFFQQKWAKCRLGVFVAVTMEYAQTFPADRVREALSSRIIGNFGQKQKATFLA